MLQIDARHSATEAAPPTQIEELRPPLSADQVLLEAVRCLECGGPEAEAPCVTACPADVDIPMFIGALARGDQEKAAATVFAENLLSGTCARVCPVEVLCEGACVLEREGRRPVEVGRLHRHAADWGLHRQGSWREVAPRRHRRVAVVGAGPAGLVCAGELAARGYSVTVYDGRDEPGGLVRYAIAPYRQLNEPLPAEAAMLAELGVELRLGVCVDSAHALRELEAAADAIVLAVGMGSDTEIGCPGASLAGVWNSLTFIAEVKAGRVVHAGRQVVVIGGGNTAVDAARIAVRLGATDVSLVYRRDEAEMPAYAHEVAEARAERVHFEWLTEPVRFHGDGQLTGVECRRTRLRRQSNNGRPRPEPLEGTEFVLPADTAVTAIGQQPRSRLFSWVDGLVLRDGKLEVDPETGQTANPKYFAGGDVTNGGATAVEAVRWGKLIARGVAATLEA
ncbi:MAG: FAD-dependent oxidoreductase [Solirubrobacteraceae bacterium]